MYTVSDLMTPEVVTLRESDDLALADNIFNLGRIRHLPVVEAHGKLVGLVTHRDLLRCYAVRGEYRGRATLARDMMNTALATVRPTTPLRSALELMLTNKFGCLPVTDDHGRLVGILTEHDLVKFAAEIVADLDVLRDHALPSSQS